ncbi:MAG TPA: DUF2073 domain-containing protein [Candidatus Nanoarchaeia archaeon]|nr:DUF2073 domain-containing protein [Candidatus Nanoarchaeia archaeon]
MLTLQFIPYHEVSDLDINGKIQKILKSVKEDKIILVEGRLAAQEESELIRRTMEVIDKKFKGIEICSVDYQPRNMLFVDKMKKVVANFLLNKASGMTIIGPATIVKEIKKDPNKIELFTLEKRGKR